LTCGVDRLEYSLVISSAATGELLGRPDVIILQREGYRPD